ncbi:molybdopterin-binding protein [Cocleimonas sp. KMM 6892]|uniref:molybdopterin molybdotransferase MoeA n=1 Tax=unclassified Cocleimonas TaxID=2639732 RepID=UPI002DB6C309|nr:MULTISPECIES: gephyrin-like molybdotransferase Glp [unclassified Cocleimonas]MEB8434180.1 molybdopterin-binding protein [Cocleimonas sp. KMM 6892]MEC4716960.1 molybdopterin-binding protein [Cocleimonas sp. KMM 6895]MEC4746452.1 molybdopterin-binding protein [Cocleimonas sp. KMM 6896]
MKDRPASCLDAFEVDAISVDEARQIIANEITPISASETVPVREGLKRYLATDIISPINVPPHTNSAMDGYALAGSDLPTTTPVDYKVSGASFAGVPSTESYQSGTVVRIMTGGVMPTGTDTVIPQELVETLDDNTIRLEAEHKAGQNVRHPGEDLAQGKKIFDKGRKLSAADIGILASLGFGEIDVLVRPKVAFFSTGDELRSIGEELKEGEIYDSNRYTLFAMLKNLDAEIIDLGVIPDTEKDIQDAFKKAAEESDIFISTGGVSVGEADYIKPTLKLLGETHFWKLAMKPGRPLTYGTVHHNNVSAKFFGLPGNPVAVMVTFLQFVQPAINYLASGKQQKPIFLKATSEENIKKRPGRTEYIRGVFEQTPDGEFSVKRTGKQGSGILMSMSLANCFIHFDADSSGVNQGDTVEILPFEGVV